MFFFQADVSHEIFRPTPRRPTDSHMSHRLNSLSPTRVPPSLSPSRAPPHNNSLAYVVSVGGGNPHPTTHSPYNNQEVPVSSVAPSGRKSNSPPTRSTPVSRGHNVTASASSRHTPQIDGASRQGSSSPTDPENRSSNRIESSKEELQQQGGPAQTTQLFAGRKFFFLFFYYFR